jgi:hypothetical protein
LRVIFRAQFQGPKGPLNALGLNLKNIVMQVDIFRKGDKWLAKSNGNPLKLQPEPTHGCAKDAVAACFTEQLSKWVLCDSEGVAIDPDHVEETPDGKFSMREVTHVGHKTQLQHTTNGPNYYITACGQEAHVNLIKSYRSQHPPLCKECRKEWEKTPAEERFKQ